MTLPSGSARAPRVDRLLLVGMMGAGKSTVARLLAARLGCAMLDTDELVERAKAMRVADIFAREGEAMFRAAESDALGTLGDAQGPLVASVGGGAVVSAQNRAAMREVGTVVWLQARTATLAARVGSGEDRPLLNRSDLGPQEALERLAADREPLYREVADLIIEVDDMSPEQAADLVMTKVAELCER